MIHGIYPSLANLPLEESGLVIVNRRGESETIVREQVFDLDKAHWYLTVQAEGTFQRRANLAVAAREIARQFLEPNLVFDKGMTDANKDAELAAVTGEKGWVYKDQKIVILSALSDLETQRKALEASAAADPTNPDTLIACHRLSGADAAFRAANQERIRQAASEMRQQLGLPAM